ncbi:MAG: hypothetical protein ACI3U8_07860 [Candidatus Onthomonas sp.]
MKRNCPVCGTALGHKDDHCPNCGVICPGKWFKFIIYFQLFLSALMGLFSGIGLLTGSTYEAQGLDVEWVYDYFPGLRAVDLIMSVGLIALAVLSIVVRQKLAHYRQGAPKQYLLLLGGNMVLSIFYIIAASAVLGGLVMDASTVTQLVVSAVMIGVNKVYFDKRAELFAS